MLLIETNVSSVSKLGERTKHSVPSGAITLSGVTLGINAILYSFSSLKVNSIALCCYYTAISPDGRYMIYYAYNAKYGDLDISFSPVKAWNSSLIDQFYTKFGTPHVAVPSVAVEGGLYQFVEAPTNANYYNAGFIEFVRANMYVYGGDADALNAYVSALDEAGWTVLGSGTSYAAKILIPGEGYLRIEAAYSAKTGAIEVTFYAKLDAIPVAEFPAEDVAKLLGSDVTDTVPAYSGTNGGYSILNDYYGTAVVVEVEAGKELDAVAAYIAQIKEAGYTSYKDSEDMFASANGQILVQITKGTIGTMNISFKACPTMHE